MLSYISATPDTSLGGDNNLGVVLHLFQINNVLCYGRGGPPYLSCTQLLGEMNVDQGPRVFGDPNDPATDLAVPYSLNSRKPSPTKYRSNKVELR